MSYTRNFPFSLEFKFTLAFLLFSISLQLQLDFVTAADHRNHKKKTEYNGPLKCYQCHDGCDDPVGYLSVCPKTGLEAFCWTAVLKTSERTFKSKDKTFEKKLRWPRRGCGYGLIWIAPRLPKAPGDVSMTPYNLTERPSEAESRKCPEVKYVDIENNLTHYANTTYSSCHFCNGLHGCNMNYKSKSTRLFEYGYVGLSVLLVGIGVIFSRVLK